MILNQFFIFKDNRIIYQRIYGKGININTLQQIINNIKSDIKINPSKYIGTYDFFNHKLSYLYESLDEIFFLLVTKLT
ncbi:MAG: hypothetical protein ACFE8P_10615, partial [Promethearchaeota archaeon]